jgi:hypothetical protein
MSEGLKIYGADGRLILDGTKRCGRILAMPYITGPNSGSYQDDRFAQGQPFAAFQSSETFHTWSGTGGIRKPIINYDAGSRTWSWVYSPSSGATDTIASGFIILGVY